jgi:hypothetical protein
MASTTNPTAKDAVTVCPECGAKIPKAGMSLCPYCASPLQKSPGLEQDRNPIVKRLLGLEEKPEFKEALQETPPWTPEYAQARNQLGQGRVFLIIGLILLGTSMTVAEGLLGLTLRTGGTALSALGAIWLILGLSTSRRLDKQRIIARSAYLVQRRSDTALAQSGKVTYYFTITFGDGSEGEFSYAGRGVNEELYSNGMTGVAFTRGQELLHMTRVRA